MSDGSRPEPTRQGVSPEAVAWGYRLLAGREPLTQEEYDSFLAMPDLDAMRRAFSNIEQFHAFFDAVVSGHPAYAMPLFLMRPGPADGPEWRFRQPDLDNPVCQLCTQSQFDDEAFTEIAEAMAVHHRPGRAEWEQAWIISMLASLGLVAEGKRGIAIETREERVAAVIAARGVTVLATGAEALGRDALEARRNMLFHPAVVHAADFEERVRFHRLDPREIGRVEQDDIDFCVSLDMPGRLGSVEATLEFLMASLAPLKPGGVALHTLPFNLTSDQMTWEFPGLTLLRRRDIEELHRRLAREGHAMLPFNTHPGHAPEDERVTSVPGAMPGHRQRNGVLVSTSFGLAIRKAG